MQINNSIDSAPLVPHPTSATASACLLRVDDVGGRHLTHIWEPWNSCAFFFQLITTNRACLWRCDWSSISFFFWDMKLNQMSTPPKHGMHFGSEKLLFASLNFELNQFFLSGPQNCPFSLLGLTKPFAQPPWAVWG